MECFPLQAEYKYNNEIQAASTKGSFVSASEEQLLG